MNTDFKPLEDETNEEFLYRLWLNFATGTGADVVDTHYNLSRTYKKGGKEPIVVIDCQATFHRKMDSLYELGVIHDFVSYLDGVTHLKLEKNGNQVYCLSYSFKVITGSYKKPADTLSPMKYTYPETTLKAKITFEEKAEKNN